MSAKRASATTSGASGSPDHAITNAVLMLAAIGCGVSLLVQKGRLSWPPISLLASLSTLAGCLALAGPLILARSAGNEGSLGRLIWLTGGLLVWLIDLAAVIQGQAKSLSWTTPLPDRIMGLAILAVLAAGWKCGLAGRDWSWTNVVGWALGLFWVAMAMGSLFLTPSWGSPGPLFR
jgi:hypothetical protein